MKRTITLFLVLVSIVLAGISFQAQALDTSGFNNDVATVSRVNSAVSSAAVTAQSGRKTIIIAAEATGELWVTVGNSTATLSQNISVSKGTPFVAQIGPNIHVSYIASTVFAISITQLGR